MPRSPSGSPVRRAGQRRERDHDRRVNRKCVNLFKCKVELWLRRGVLLAVYMLLVSHIAEHYYTPAHDHAHKEELELLRMAVDVETSTAQSFEPMMLPLHREADTAAATTLSAARAATVTVTSEAPTAAATKAPAMQTPQPTQAATDVPARTIHTHTTRVPSPPPPPPTTLPADPQSPPPPPPLPPPPPQKPSSPPDQNIAGGTGQKAEAKKAGAKAGSTADAIVERAQSGRNKGNDDSQPSATVENHTDVVQATPTPTPVPSSTSKSTPVGKPKPEEADSKFQAAAGSGSGSGAGSGAGSVASASKAAGWAALQGAGAKKPEKTPSTAAAPTSASLTLSTSITGSPTANPTAAAPKAAARETATAPSVHGSVKPPDLKALCSLNGRALRGGGCRCDAQWEGEQCDRLRLLPAKPTNGLQGTGRFSSWGGSVLYDDTSGQHQMFVSVFAHQCGLNAWRPNSAIGRAVASAPEGPYKLLEIVKPNFAHSPVALRGPKGEWLVWHVGAGNTSTKCDADDEVQCKPVTNCSKGCTGGHVDTPSGISFHGPASVLTSASPAGPWTDTIIGACDAVPGCARTTSYKGNGNDLNPAPFVEADGSVKMLWRSINYTSGGESYYAQASAASWAGEYKWSTANLFSAYSDCHIEDAFLYKNKRGYHALFHSDCDPTVDKTGAAGGHAYSLDGLSWTFSASRTYDRTAQLTNGSTWSFWRRERPKFIMDKNGEITHLINGVSLRGQCDHTFTFVQPLNLAS